ncbi:MATE family efflux transporter [Serpentinicella alkaliphila]|uniref:Multidrug export protein MepA n=1 Tax=Serpentinicella alkaliphila TaxID=1734049 RepID=A0A4R2TNM8_9FIRM|nr:MATE family efflux transporter [Serpentinicella alkaliphila]QUH24407.1 MATE family efflux transporter [Serpentinicella alkaliphila]TCQ04202.1 putative MATE family efflux protein [Serpentinicella alkaliphila]
MDERSKQLSEEKVWKLLFKYSLPATIGMIVNALYNVVDRIFIGRGVGAEALAGITIGFPIMLVLMALGMLVGVGGAALVSIKLGEQKRNEAELILGNSVLLLIGITLLVSVVGLVFLDSILMLFGASQEVLPYAREYLRIILGGAVFQAIGFGMNNFIRAEGNPRIAMITMLIGAITNIVLDPLFIFVFGWGIRGAAYATIIAQGVSSIWVLAFFFRQKSLLKIRIENMKLHPAVIKNILAIGSAPCALQFGSSVVITIFNKQLSVYGGDIAISALGIIHSVSMFILMPIIGINQGSQPIIGYNYGAKRFDRVKETLKSSITAATMIVSLGFILTRLYPHSLINLFNRDDLELVRIGTEGLRIFLVTLPVIGFQIVGSNYFMAVGKPKKSMFLSLSRQVIVLIPMLLILPNFLGLYGVWLAVPVSDTIASILTGIFLLKEVKQLNTDNEIENNLQE